MHSWRTKEKKRGEMIEEVKKRQTKVDTTVRG